MAKVILAILILSTIVVLGFASNIEAIKIALGISDEKWNCAKDKIKANLLKNDDYTKCAKAVTSKDCKALVPHLKNCPGYPDLDVKCLNNLTSNKASDQIFKNCIFNGASVGCIKVAQEVLFC